MNTYFFIAHSQISLVLCDFACTFAVDCPDRTFIKVIFLPNHLLTT